MRVLQAFIKQLKWMSSQQTLFRMVVILYSLSRKHKQKIKMEDGRVESLVFAMKKQHVRSEYLAVFPSGTEGVKQGEFNGKCGTWNTAIFVYADCMLSVCL